MRKPFTPMTEDELSKRLAGNLRKYRGELTQTIVAKESGVSGRAYRYWESGSEVNPPQIRNLLKLANYLKVPIERLLA